MDRHLSSFIEFASENCDLHVIENELFSPTCKNRLSGFIEKSCVVFGCPSIDTTVADT